MLLLCHPGYIDGSPMCLELNGGGPLLIDELTTTTSMLCDAYLSGKPECWEPYLSEGFSFVGPMADSVCVGLAAFRARCKAYVGELSPLRLYCEQPEVMLATKHAVVLLVSAVPEASAQPQICMRITLVWRLKGNQPPRLAHMHASFSHRSHMLFSQVRNEEAEPASSPDGNVLVRDIDGVSRYINSGEVVYLEAAHQYVLFHTLFGTFKVRRTLSDVLEKQSGMLVRVHRSFAVNVSMVQSISADGVQMVTGDVVPTPSKRLSAVREDICRMRGVKALEKCPPPEGQDD